MRRESHEYPGLEMVMRDVGEKIGASLPKGVGFALFVFNFGEGGGLAYMSNSRREDMAATVKEWLERFGDEGEEEPEPPHAA